MHTDRDACYQALKSRDRRFDGVFVTAVHSTGIYCRPSCPARTPRYEGVSFHPTAASAQRAGFRACKRCLPDATPGSPEWDVAAAVAGRAMRLIADGVVEREGVPGLAARLGYGPRQLGRILTAELGAGPLALARARRAQVARVLIEDGELSFADVAFAAGFSSVRQFNETLREVYAASPTELRGRRPHPAPAPAGAEIAGQLRLRLAVRTPFSGTALLDFLATRAVPGIESSGPGWYARSLALPRGPGTVRLALFDDLRVGEVAQVEAVLRLTDLRDAPAALERVRRMLDADCDPVAVDAALGGDPVLAPLVASAPGLRVPGHVDGAELAVRAVLGQQVTVAAARTLAGRLVAAYGTKLPEALRHDGLEMLFPPPATLADVDLALLLMPRSRAAALVGLAAALAAGQVSLDRGGDRVEVRAALLAVPGIGAWTADYIALRALGAPDVFLDGDAGVRAALARLGNGVEPQRWSPWRSYALIHLWRSLTSPTEPDRTRRSETVQTKEMI